MPCRFAEVVALDGVRSGIHAAGIGAMSIPQARLMLAPFRDGKEGMEGFQDLMCSVY